MNTLAYMLACLNEGLRIYPPIPGYLPRRVPSGGAMISGSWVPEGVTFPPREGMRTLLTSRAIKRQLFPSYPLLYIVIRNISETPISLCQRGGLEILDTLMIKGM